MSTLTRSVPLGRRDFLKAAGALGGSATLSACGARSGVTSLEPDLASGGVSLAQLPTPIESLPRLSAHLGGPRLLVKRDDQTGLATGGNKTRKLEALVADALAQGTDTLVTLGSAQSNHCRQTAAAAAKQGLDCVLLLRGGAPTEAPQGNLRLDALLGADLRFGAPSLEETGQELRREGRRPYLIPTGGSNAVGVTAYVAAMEEALGQLEVMGETPDAIVLATGSGGTQAGLVVGARAAGYGGRVLGISVSRSAADARERIATLCNATARRLGLPSGGFLADQIEVDDSFLGAGHGEAGELEANAIRTVARSEGLLLDPVYTGRAFGGLMSLIEDGTFGPGQTVLFWHTGGIPALFTSRYADLLT